MRAIAELLEEVGRAVDQVGDRDIDRRHACTGAPARGTDDAHAVGDGAGRKGNDDEPLRHQACGLQGAFGHANDRTRGDLPGGGHAGIPEARDDEGVGVGRVLTHLGEHTDGGDGLFGVAFDARHAPLGLDTR